MTSEVFPEPADIQSEERLSFDPLWYLRTYGDVQASGMDPWDHYLRMGRAEGRQPGPLRALELDHLLWRGFEDMALPGLQELLAGENARDRAAAGWVLARWWREAGDAVAADAALAVFHDTPEPLQPLRFAGPWLLGVQLALEVGDAPRAGTLLDAGVARFGPLPDFDLARLLIHSHLGMDDYMLSDDLHRLYTARGLVPVSLDTRTGSDARSRFDRLQGSAASAPDGPHPLVSVIVPVYNGAAGLGLALSGLSAQSWPALEILVVDDGSTDDTVAVARKAAERDDRIKIIALETNQGAYPARNAGFAAATGAFITVHDADDWSHPEKIALQVGRLIADDSLQATVSHWVRVSDDLDMTRWRMEDAWIYRNVSSLMVRATVRDEIGFWDRVRVNADTEYYYRLIAAYGAQAIAEVAAGIPLAFGHSAAQSLTGQSATHLRTQFGGVRRDYMDAALYWQACAGERADLYLPQHPEQRPFRIPALIGVGDADGPETDFDILSASDLFDAQWYRLSNMDVLLADVNPVRHYLEGGAVENRDPGPRFSSGGYRRAQGLTAEENPLLHFERHGRQGDPLPGFKGALSGSDLPRVMMFAHTSGQTLFGAERSMLSVVSRMARRGQAPVVVLPALRNPAYLEALLEMSVAVEVVPQMWRHALRDPAPETVSELRDLIRQYDVQEVHVNTLVLDAPLLAARAQGVPSAVHVREMPAQDVALCRALGDTAEALRARLLAQADRFIANSEPVADWLDAPARTVVRPNSVDEALFDLPYLAHQSLTVALISSNITKKGIADFLEVARIVAQQGADIRFSLFGPASVELHLLRPWPENVSFRGYAETPATALAEVDVVMSLSKFAESFGRTVMEAMAAGRPVICYDRGAPPTLVQSGHTGFAVPADDTQAAARAVLALHAARTQRARMSVRARVRARTLQDQAMQA